MSKTKWPKSVPVLEYKDIGRGSYRNDDGTPCCIVGHCTDTFYNLEAYAKAIATICRVIGVEDFRLTTWNDNAGPAQRADAWNAAMRKLGYTQVYTLRSSHPNPGGGAQPQGGA